MSANTGRAPAIMIASAEYAAESGDVMTSSPGPMPEGAQRDRERVGAGADADARAARRTRRRTRARTLRAPGRARTSRARPRARWPPARRPRRPPGVELEERDHRTLLGSAAARRRSGQVLAVERDRAAQALRADRPAAASPTRLAELRRVGVEAADVDPLLFRRPRRRKRTDPVPAISSSSVDQIAVADRLVAADVEHLAVARVGRARPQERIGRIVHVDEVAQLRAVAEDLDLASLDRQADEPADEALAVVLDQLTRAVDVGQPQRAGAHAEDVVVEQVVVLAGRLVDAVDVGRAHQMVLVDRQAVRRAVDLPRAGEDDPHRRVVPPAGLEHRQLRAAVDLEIRVRVAHAVDVADLPGEVEDHLAVLHQRVHRRLVAHVGDVDADAVLDAVDVEPVAAVVRDSASRRSGRRRRPRPAARARLLPMKPRPPVIITRRPR